MLKDSLGYTETSRLARATQQYPISGRNKGEKGWMQGRKEGRDGQIDGQKNLYYLALSKDLEFCLLACNRVSLI